MKKEIAFQSTQKEKVDPTRFDGVNPKAETFSTYSKSKKERF